MNTLTRRRLMLGTAATTLLTACATRPANNAFAPIVFVHGNGDSAALWLTTLWRFESNGWPRDRLHALDMPYPRARDNDTKAQAGRSSTAESMRFLADSVEKVLAASGASQVVLIANSRGGYAVRNYIANGGGAAKVSHAILCGTPNHGVWADPKFNPGNEFNGAGPFLMALNAPQGAAGTEVTPGVKWMTIRSDHNDKYAQPDGVWIGAKGKPTHVGFDGPALKGAENVVIPGIDHRETAFSAAAFAQAFRFLTGHAPETLLIRTESRVALDGLLGGYGVDNVSGSAPSNLPLVGASVEVYATDPASGERRGAALHRKTIGADGRWGPFAASPSATYEFVIAAAGYATTHVYRSPFPRSSSIVGLRAERVPKADRGAAAVIVLTRPRGYFGVPRDRISLDGKSPPAGIPSGTPGVSSAKLELADATPRPIVGEFNAERIVGRPWPLADGHLVFLELQG
ncbi:MAG TPA: alpha/beta fold hydrolase [Burkholderiaceae bacterium]|nr:alpha/beta fold hydrolase [Burkholderiaceae bacterium]